MKRDHRQLASVPSSTKDDAIVSEASLLEWTRPRSSKLTFDQFIDHIAVDTLLDPRQRGHAGTAKQPTVLVGDLPKPTIDNHLTQTTRG